MSVYLFVCLCFSLSVCHCLSVSLPVCLPPCLSVCLPIRLSFCSVSPSTHKKYCSHFSDHFSVAFSTSTSLFRKIVSRVNLFFCCCCRNCFCCCCCRYCLLLLFAHLIRIFSCPTKRYNIYKRTLRINACQIALIISGIVSLTIRSLHSLC